MGEGHQGREYQDGEIASQPTSGNAKAPVVTLPERT